VKIISSEQLLLSAIVEVALRTVTFNLVTSVYQGARVCWFC